MNAARFSYAIVLICALSAPASAAAPPASKTGRFNVTFTERSPFSSLEDISRRIETDPPMLKPSDAVMMEYDLANESFDVCVPKTYDPRTSHGLFVWIGVTEYSPEWLDVLAKHNIIFITANNTGGRSWTVKRGLALDAVHNMKKYYNIDPSRVFICGFSAGGQMATYMLRQFPEVFTGGGIFLMGGYFYFSYELDKTRNEPTTRPSDPPWHAPIESVKTSMKIVIVRGEGDPTGWIPEEGQSDYEALTLDGFTHVHLFVLPKWGHVHPNAEWFEKIIASLEEEPTRPPTTKPTTDQRPHPGQIAQAKRLYYSALYTARSWANLPGRYGIRRVSKEEYKQRARDCLQQVIDDFPTTPWAAKARETLQKIDEEMEHSATQPVRPRDNATPLPARGEAG